MHQQCQRKLRKIMNNVSKQPDELCTGQSVRSWCSPESGHLSPWHRDGVFLYDKATLPTLGTRTLERFSFCGQDSNTCLWKRAHSPPLLPSQMLSCLERPTIGSHGGIFWCWSLLSTQPSLQQILPPHSGAWSFLSRGALFFTQHVAVRGLMSPGDT